MVHVILRLSVFKVVRKCAFNILLDHPYPQSWLWLENIPYIFNLRSQCCICFDVWRDFMYVLWMKILQIWWTKGITIMTTRGLYEGNICSKVFRWKLTMKRITKDSRMSSLYLYTFKVSLIITRANRGLGDFYPHRNTSSFVVSRNNEYSLC